MRPELSTLLKTLNIHVPQLSANPKSIKATPIWRMYHFLVAMIPVGIFSTYMYFYTSKKGEINTEAMVILGLYEKQMIWDETDTNILRRVKSPNILLRQFIDYPLTGKRARYACWLKLNRRVRDFKNIETELSQLK
jgi:hypothetical protein